MRPLLFMTPNALQVGKKAKELQDTRKKKEKKKQIMLMPWLCFLLFKVKIIQIIEGV